MYKNKCYKLLELGDLLKLAHIIWDETPSIIYDIFSFLQTAIHVLNDCITVAAVDGLQL